MIARLVALEGRHRSWCALWSLQPFCDCEGVDVVDLVEWWAAAARSAARDSTVRLAG